MKYTQEELKPMIRLLGRLEIKAFKISLPGNYYQRMVIKDINRVHMLMKKHSTETERNEARKSIYSKFIK